MNKIVTMGSSQLKQESTPRLIGEILQEYLLHSNQPLAEEYRRRGGEKLKSMFEGKRAENTSDELTKDVAPWKK